MGHQVTTEHWQDRMDHLRRLRGLSKYQNGPTMDHLRFAEATSSSYVPAP